VPHSSARPLCSTLSQAPEDLLLAGHLAPAAKAPRRPLENVASKWSEPDNLWRDHSGIWEESILLPVGQPASYDAGIRGKPQSGFPPNSIALGLIEAILGSHRVAPMMPKAYPKF